MEVVPLRGGNGEIQPSNRALPAGHIDLLADLDDTAVHIQ